MRTDLSFGLRVQRRVAAIAGSPAFWLLFVGVLLALPIARSIRAERNLPPHRPVSSAVQEFGLIDQQGAAFGSEKLRGRVWIANFSFVGCTECTQMMAKMISIQHRSRQLGDAIHLVTFSADPDHDRGEAWADYAKLHRPSARMWSFLTGSPEAMRGVFKDFQVVPRTPQSRFTLVDTDMKVRGSYDLSDDDAIHLLIRDAGLLINRGN